MQHKEQPFESLCAFLQKDQQTQADLEYKVRQQQAQLNYQAVCIVVLIVIQMCLFLYMLTL